jgi:para-nitrobenzyl esterase
MGYHFLKLILPFTRGIPNMRLTTIAAIAILGSSMTVPVVLAADPPAAAGKMTTAATPLGDLLDNPGSKAVLAKYAPVLTQGGQVDQARPMTLKALQQYMPDLTDEVLGKIDAELAKVK